ncbi:putative bifunctional diguanylate cyclase/phosphodiesterase [Paenibacillus thermotolerans]|uniref:putative bifunctional diguanylate cyclase/phosphodiesterase n=1 Tax=Paenibacillus thermotolerans TaxID=3027807 RepID=UPI002368C913|nr:MULTISPECIES: EAL domain-containing protein [unclassified Paenibacillus]
MKKYRIEIMLVTSSAIFFSALIFRWIRSEQTMTDRMLSLLIVVFAVFAAILIVFLLLDRKKTADKLESRLRQTDEVFSSLFDSMPMGVSVFDEQGKLLRSNPASYLITGYNPQEYYGVSFLEFLDEEHKKMGMERFLLTLQGEIQTFDLKIRNYDGFDLELHVTSVPVAGGASINGVIVIYQDVTVKRRTEERIKHLAFYDDLTGLPNRRLFREMVSEEIAAREQGSLYIMLLNIDRFKFVNSSLGQDIGDVLLLQLADRLQQSIAGKGAVARLEGDEFGLIVKDESGELAPEAISEAIFRQLETPFSIQKHSFHITVSIGIAECSGTSGGDEQEFIKNAATALSKAKEKGKNHIEIFTPEMNKSLVHKFTMESELRRAIQEEQLFLLYQPQFRIDSGEMIGAEALLRWRHPERGIVPPGVFIPIAEDSGLIVPLSEWVLKEACMQNKAWQEEGYPAIPVSVNLSMRQFLQPNLTERIQAILTETGLEPQYLELEITESMTMDVEFATATLISLKKLGIRISIDDFGTGYSSLNYLKNFPVDKLKIDKSFVNDILNDPNDAAIVRTIITMAHHLKQKVIAEGVETEQQLGFLRQYECDEIQGYLMSPPVPVEKIKEFLLSWKEAAVSRHS